MTPSKQATVSDMKNESGTEIFDDLYLGVRAGGALRKKRRGEPLTALHVLLDGLNGRDQGADRLAHQHRQCRRIAQRQPNHRRRDVRQQHRRMLAGSDERHAFSDPARNDQEQEEDQEDPTDGPAQCAQQVKHGARGLHTCAPRACGRPLIAGCSTSE